MVKRLQRRIAGNKLLIGILGIYLLLVIITMWVTPPFEGPDEPQHFAYIEWLVRNNDFPPQGEASWQTPVQQESSQPPFYYLLASLPARLVSVDDPQATFRPNPYPRRFPLTYPDNDNRAVHYPSEADPLAGGWLALYLARLISLLFGLLLIVAVFGLARQAVPQNKNVALMSAFFVATIPQVIFISSVVSNDIPVAALSTVSLWLLAMLMRQGYTWVRAVSIGVAVGLTTLMKANGLVIGLPILVALLWLGWSKRESWLTVIKAGALIGLSAFIVAGWWFIRAWVLFGSPLGLETHDQAPWAFADPALSGDPRLRWFEVFRSFWIWLGWGTIRPPDSYYTIFFVMVILALAGLLLATWRRWKSTSPRFDVTAAVFLMLFSAIIAIAFVLEIWMRRVTAPYGRLLFPAIGALVLFLIVGWRAIHPKLPLIPIAITLVTSIAAPFWLLRPAYALPEFLDEGNLVQASTLNWFFGLAVDRPIAELLSVAPQTEQVEAGSLLPVETCWRAIEQTDQEMAFLLHVIGPENRLIANRRTLPGLGHYPSGIWQPGAVWCDLIHVLVADESVDQTLVYKIEIGIHDPEADTRLPIFTAEGQQIEAAFVSDVLITQNEDEDILPGPIEEPVLLLDYEADSVWRAGHEQTLILSWMVAEPLDQDYQQYVHLRDSESGETVTQADGPPLSGWYPTSRWLPNMPITDVRVFPLASDISPGYYDLTVGFYDLASGQRFGPEFHLQTIEVKS